MNRKILFFDESRKLFGFLSEKGTTQLTGYKKPLWAINKGRLPQFGVVTTRTNGKEFQINDFSVVTDNYEYLYWDRQGTAIQDQRPVELV
ncbi:MAG: hypothetical protein IPG53_10640 [Ignavibacteriales bacterium]|nr:hypothetical protein [Ignavibacteriales bacterium]